ncbi:MAG: DUF3365 domain-containing protein [Gammaproteobacteria bacterium]|nr:DUF3365 domain-containing protein [Gammaproteobacteria bacterium]
MLNKRYGLWAAVLLIAPILAWSDDESPLLLKSRELTADYATQLKAALQESMAAGGPVEAISVCTDVAPQLASQISRASGARVGRTSWRFRNPANAPNDWEAQALNHLEATGNQEYFEMLPNGGARYLKAIPTGPVCVSCHGETLAPVIKDQLAEAYPHDRATGFAVGDLRGAFSVSWPAASSETD